MLEFKRQATGKSRIKLLKEMLKNNLDKIDIIFDVFGINHENKNSLHQRNKMYNDITKGTQIEEQAQNICKKSPVHFLLGEKYDN